MTALAVALLLTATSQAGAVTVGRLAHTPDAGPVIAGDGAAWVERRVDGGLVVRAGDQAAASRVIANFPPEPGTRLEATIVGSRDWVSVALTRSVARFPKEGTTRSVETFAGAPGAALTSFSAPCDSDSPDWVRTVDAAGELLAFAGPECGRNSVRDRSGAARWAAPDGVFGLRVAGRFAAWLEPRRNDERAVVVVDVGTGEVVLRVPPGPGTRFVEDIDLSADGTVVILAQAAGPTGAAEGRLRTVSPGDPRLRTLQPAVALDAPVRIAGRRILAFESSQERRRQRLIVVDAGSGRTLEASSSRAFVEPGFAGGYDFDGERVTSVVRECRGVAIDLGSRLPARFDRGEPCRLRLQRRPSLRGRRLAARVSCAGFRRDCAARVSVRSKGREMATRVSRPGGEVSFALSRSERRRIRRGARLQITADYGDFAGGRRARHGSVRRSVTARVRRGR